jgi:hypothetical protein
MFSVLPGIIIVLGIAIVAGGIAYIGDRVGHQVGRKRMTLFGLRPKYTSTIVAVATGMLIAISVTLVALAASDYVRQAFFHIGQLNEQVNQLRAQAMQAQKELGTTREGNLAVSNGAVVGPPALIDMSTPEDVQLRALSSIFDDTVKYANRAAPAAGLKPYTKHASDPDIQTKLAQLLTNYRNGEDARGDHGLPILFVPVTYSNLFRGEQLSFTFEASIDTRTVAAGETVATLDVDGGAAISAVDAQTLLSRAQRALFDRGFPPALLNSPLSGFDQAHIQDASNNLSRVRGRFRLVARSATDVFPHTGGYQLLVSLEPISK